MPLSEEELRLLEQMERALVEEDPKLASTLRGTSFHRAARRRAILGGAVILVGVALLVAAVLLSQPILGVVGFVVMLGGAVLAVGSQRGGSQGASTGSVRSSGRAGLGVVDGGRSHRPRRPRGSAPFMQRMEERWRRRRERGF
ncbi:MAG: DUF3040 domain-containing protein [Nocardioides sp.]|nr:DUF3040 domain-containing protein [Nocardioides sp.]